VKPVRIPLEHQGEKGKKNVKGVRPGGPIGGRGAIWNCKKSKPRVRVRTPRVYQGIQAKGLEGKN